MEVIATFYDEARARNYANVENGQSLQPEAPQLQSPPLEEEAAAPKGGGAKPNGVETELSQRQRAVLEALRAKMDDNNLVAVRAAVLAEAAKIPLGSLHSVLGSLEKKQLIQTSRAGSARAPAVYEVL
jgi:hypothetical protein